jgi:CheY-like chemotaxis protein
MRDRDLILCVDDEENQLAVRQAVLEKAGYLVLTAHSGQQALNLLDSHRIDLVLSDHLMPGMTGTKLARQIKARNPKLPVILLSAVNELPEDASCADLFMSKLDGPVAMCQNISAVLSRSKNGNGPTHVLSEQCID